MVAGDVERDVLASAARRGGQARQKRTAGGRPHQVYVKLSDEEYVQMSARAISMGLSVPRLMVESVLNDGPAGVAERNQLYRELMGIRRLVAALGNNVNQLARAANATGQVEPQTGPALAATRRVMGRLDGLLASMPAPAERSGSRARRAAP